MRHFSALQKGVLTAALLLALGLVIVGQLLDNFRVEYSAKLSIFHTHATAYHYNLWNGVRQFWKRDLKGLAIVVTLFSGIWPIVKILATLSVLWFPRNEEKHQKYKNRALSVLGNIGKWSFFDVWVVFLVMIAFSVTHTEAFGELIIYGSAGSGISIFATAIVLSQICAMYMQDPDNLLAAAANTQETGHYFYSLDLLKTKGRKMGFGVLVMLLALTVMTLLATDIFSTSFEVNSSKTVKNYSVTSLMALSGSGQNILVYALFVVCVCVVPWVRTGLLLLVGSSYIILRTDASDNQTTGFTYTIDKAVRTIKWLQKWWCLDVFCVALIINIAELGNIIHKKKFGPAGAVTLSVSVDAFPVAYVFFVVVFIESALCNMLHVEAKRKNRKSRKEGEVGSGEETASLIP